MEESEQGLRNSERKPGGGNEVCQVSIVVSAKLHFEAAEPLVESQSTFFSFTSLVQAHIVHTDDPALVLQLYNPVSSFTGTRHDDTLRQRSTGSLN